MPCWRRGRKACFLVRGTCSSESGAFLDHYLHDDSTQISSLGTDEDRAVVSGVVLEG
jgi:hypothetical protein